MDARQDYTEQLHEKFLLGPDEVQSLTVPATVRIKKQLILN